MPSSSSCSSSTEQQLLRRTVRVHCCAYCTGTAAACCLLCAAYTVPGIPAQAVTAAAVPIRTSSVRPSSYRAAGRKKHAPRTVPYSIVAYYSVPAVPYLPYPVPPVVRGQQAFALPVYTTTHRSNSSKQILKIKTLAHLLEAETRFSYYSNRVCQ